MKLAIHNEWEWPSADSWVDIPLVGGAIIAGVGSFFAMAIALSAWVAWPLLWLIPSLIFGLFVRAAFRGNVQCTLAGNQLLLYNTFTQCPEVIRENSGLTLEIIKQVDKNDASDLIGKLIATTDAYNKGQAILNKPHTDGIYRNLDEMQQSYENAAKTLIDSDARSRELV